MVKEVKQNSERLYTCEVCMFAYKDKKTASDCQDFCTTHNSCSMEITKHAVGVLDDGKLVMFRKKE